MSSEYGTYSKMLLLGGRWLAQIYLVAPGDPSEVARAVGTSRAVAVRDTGVNTQGEYFPY